MLTLRVVVKMRDSICGVPNAVLQSTHPVNLSVVTD